MHEIYQGYALTTQITEKAGRSLYLAHPVNDPGHIVVLKRFSAECLDPQQDEASILQKAHTIQQLQHRGIVPMLAIGIEQQQLYVVSEYMPRGSLRNHLDSVSPKQLKLQKAVTIFLQIGEALHYAHEHGLVHGNLKPENVVFDSNGNALLTDFSFSSLINQSKLDYKSNLPTLGYMAPEAFVGTASVQCDQYSLGCIAYELITGTAPFTASDFPAMWLKHTKEAPEPLSTHALSLPPAINQAVLKSLEKDPARRHASVLTFVEALRPFSSSNTMPLEQSQAWKTSQFAPIRLKGRSSGLTPTPPSATSSGLHSGTLDNTAGPYQASSSLLDQASAAPDAASSPRTRQANLSSQSRPLDSSATHTRKKSRRSITQPEIEEELMPINAPIDPADAWLIEPSPSHKKADYPQTRPPAEETDNGAPSHTATGNNTSMPSGSLSASQTGSADSTPEASVAMGEAGPLSLPEATPSPTPASTDSRTFFASGPISPIPPVAGSGPLFPPDPEPASLIPPVAGSGPLFPPDPEPASLIPPENDLVAPIALSDTAHTGPTNPALGVKPPKFPFARGASDQLTPSGSLSSGPLASPRTPSGQHTAQPRSATVAPATPASKPKVRQSPSASSANKTSSSKKNTKARAGATIGTGAAAGATALNTALTPVAPPAAPPPVQPRPPRQRLPLPPQQRNRLLIVLGVVLFLALMSGLRPYAALLATPDTNPVVIVPTPTPTLPPTPRPTKVPRRTPTAQPTPTVMPTPTPTTAPKPTQPPAQPAPTRPPQPVVVPTPVPPPAPTATPIPVPNPQPSITLNYQEYNVETNLTNAGTTDWRQWGLNSATDVDFKAGVQSQISDYALIGNNVIDDHQDCIDFSWSDGTPVQSTGPATACVYTPGLYNGFSITVQASNTPRTLKLYVGAIQAQGMLTASLDGLTQTDASLDERFDPNNTSDNAVYTITFSTNLPNQRLTVSYTASAVTSGSSAVMLEAAALQ